MSAPVTERTRTARGPGGARVDTGRTGTLRARRGAAPAAARTAAAPARSAAVPAQRGVNASAEGREPRGAAARAYARREDRTRRLLGSRGDGAAAAGRPRFVLLMMVLLASGLVATLWLSTAAAADSYRLHDARNAARQMTEQSERLHREVATLSSPTSLAERATQLGMVPVQDSARLVVDPRGDVDVVGVPRAAVAPAPPAPPCPPADTDAPPDAAPACAPAEHADGAAAPGVPAAEAADADGDGAGPASGRRDGPAGTTAAADGNGADPTRARPSGTDAATAGTRGSGRTDAAGRAAGTAPAGTGGG